ncbi:MAG: class I SAM-dependent methyltransferase [Myxococcota bacterium]
MTDFDQYYDDLRALGDDTTLAGWRHPLEQALRFELAMEALPPEVHHGSWLDVGCGPGGLPRYLSDTGRVPATYLGIDRYAPSIERARSLCPEFFFAHQDVFEAQGQFDVVVAIGAAVCGVPRGRDDFARRQHIARLLRKLLELSTQHVCLILLNQDAIRRDPWLAREHALIGLTRAEVAALRRVLERQAPEWRWRERWDALTTDVVLHLRRGADPAAPAARFAAHERVLTGPWAEGVEQERRAWLWMISGAPDRAAAVWSG